MGHIIKTPAGTYRANWRDGTGRQKAKTFRTKKDAAAFLAATETALHRGSYVDPHAGRIRFGDYATRWLATRNDEITTAARDRSIMRTHVLPQWGSVPIGRIDHLSVQGWVTDLGSRVAPATVTQCLRLAAGVLRTAVRDHLIGTNPCDGVKVPRSRRTGVCDQTISPAALRCRLLPAIPDRYRALVAVAGGAGLRWGEGVGLRWDAIDLPGQELHVVRVAVEVAGHVTAKPYPKTRAGRRTIPLPDFVLDALTWHRACFPPGPAGEVFTNTTGGPLRRTLFRARVWRPALVVAGLLGRVDRLAKYKYRAVWPDPAGLEHSAEFTTERDAVAHVAKMAAGGLRFHDLRHSYATWLVSNGAPINDVQAVMGHERASTTLDRYTHHSPDRGARLRKLFADGLLTLDPVPGPETMQDPSEEGS